ncbi:MAG: hypothetical protein R3343_13585 [Nitriliruptorales bacterium]|nr:hypothetical protein [Nitriliruptorales bacterium]
MALRSLDRIPPPSEAVVEIAPMQPEDVEGGEAFRRRGIGELLNTAASSSPRR